MLLMLYLRFFLLIVFFFFFFNDTATTEIYTLSLHDALPIGVIHWATSGETNELPAPEIVVPLCRAGEAPAAETATAATAAARARMLSIRIWLPSFGMVSLSSSGFGGNVRPGPGWVGYGAVAVW